MSWYHCYDDHDPRPYFDGDVKPSVVEHWRRDYNPYPYGGPGVEEDVKPAKKQPRPPSGGSLGGRRVHDDDGGTAALSWPVPAQFHSTLRTQESIAGLRARYGVPDGFGLLPAGAYQVACDPPPMPRGGGGRGASAVPICVYAQAFEAGMRLPLHPLLSDALSHAAGPQRVARALRVRRALPLPRRRRALAARVPPLLRAVAAAQGEGVVLVPRQGDRAGALRGPAHVQQGVEGGVPARVPSRCPVRWGAPSKEALSDPLLTEAEAAVARRLAQGHGVVDLKTYLSESNLVAAKISRAPASLGAGTEASRGQQPKIPPPETKKRKAPAAASSSAASGGSSGVLRSELVAKERALAQAKGKISKLEQELDKAKKRELTEARQALAFERQLGTHVIKAEPRGKGGGGGKRPRGAQ